MVAATLPSPVCLEKSFSFVGLVYTLAGQSAVPTAHKFIQRFLNFAASAALFLLRKFPSLRIKLQSTLLLAGFCRRFTI